MCPSTLLSPTDESTSLHALKDFVSLSICTDFKTLLVITPAHVPVRARYLKDILKGDADRLKKFKLNIEDPPRRKHLVFIGGAVLGDVMKNRHEFWATKEEWDEEGARVLQKYR